MRELFRASGTYALLLSATASMTVEVGALGAVGLAPGAFVYVGSAFGPGGLAARLRRHVQPQKASPHWHVDYLRAALSLHGAWISTDDARHECTWAQSIACLESSSIPLPGAGASDCACSTHFFRVAPLADAPGPDTPGPDAPGPDAEVAELRPADNPSHSPMSRIASQLTGTHTYVSAPDLRQHLLT